MTDLSGISSKEIAQPIRNHAQFRIGWANSWVKRPLGDHDQHRLTGNLAPITITGYRVGARRQFGGIGREVELAAIAGSPTTQRDAFAVRLGEPDRDLLVRNKEVSLYPEP